MARIKGIDLVGTGDCTHPGWIAELRSALEPAEAGLYILRDPIRNAFDSGEPLAAGLPNPSRADAIRFVLSGEVACVYRRDGRRRAVHHLVLLPDFDAAADLQTRLQRFGSIVSDGRPVLGLDSQDLFSLLLDSDERSILIPAHVWTPWYSALGQRSGFDSIEECYGDLAARIGAIETGLSSNPPMNWAVRSLDRYALVSNSDAHSPERLGREATILDTERSFSGLAAALRVPEARSSRGDILGTIEHFPQAGKYHRDGHRACSVVLDPAECGRRGARCPVCGRAITPGVLGRVTGLADRPVDEAEPCPDTYAGTNRRPYRHVIPLSDLVAEILDAGGGARNVVTACRRLVEEAGSEFELLIRMPESRIQSLRCPGVPGELLALAISRMQAGTVDISPGFDGVYGAVRTLPRELWNRKNRF